MMCPEKPRIIAAIIEGRGATAAPSSSAHGARLRSATRRIDLSKAFMPRGRQSASGSFRSLAAFSVLLVLLCLLQSCHQSTQPIPVPPDSTDSRCSCVSWPWDSAAVVVGGFGGSLWDYIEFWKTASPDGKYYAIVQYYLTDMSLPSGLGVYEAASGKRIMFISGSFVNASWSDDSRHLTSVNTLDYSFVIADAKAGTFAVRNDLGKFWSAVYGVGGSDILLSGNVSGTGATLFIYDTHHDELRAFSPLTVQSFKKYPFVFDQLCDSTLVWLSADQELASGTPYRVKNTIILYRLRPGSDIIENVVGPSIVFAGNLTSAIKGQLNRQNGKFIFAFDFGERRNRIYTLDLATLELIYQTPDITCAYYPLYPTWNGDDSYNATWFCLHERKATVFSGKLK
jgi:hypothetical protein